MSSLAEKLHMALNEALTSEACLWFYDALFEKPACKVGSEVLLFDQGDGAITAQYQNLRILWIEGSREWEFLTRKLDGIGTHYVEEDLAKIRSQVAGALLERITHR